MNNTRKIFSILMIVVMLTTGILEPFGLSTVTPVSAEPSVPTRGTSEVGETPENLLTMGEWLYWVEDGLAYVAGYGNTSEYSLVIPARLGGYPVAGIGRQAFAGNSGLGYVQIPTNVTRISSDAFPKGNGMTIAAYNGAYALLYAEQYGFYKTNLSTECVFAKNVLDLSGMEGSYFDLSENGVTFSAGEATFLQEGQILSFPKYAGHPTGSIGKVSGISWNGASVSVSFTMPEWGECFIQVSGEEELILDWDNVVYFQNDDLEVREIQSSGWDGKSTWVKKKLKNGKTVEFGIDFKINGPVVTYDIGMKGVNPDLKKAKVEFPVQFTPYVKYGESVKIYDHKSSNPTDKAEVLNWDLCNIPVGTPTSPVSGSIRLGVVVELKGEILVSATVNTTFCFTYNNGKSPKPSINFSANNFKVEASADVKFGPELAVSIKLGWKGFNIEFCSITVGLYFHLSANGKYQTIKEGVLPSILDLNVELYFEPAYSIKIGIVSMEFLTVKKSFNLYFENKGNFGLKHTFLRGHVENGKLTAGNVCTLVERNVVYKVLNQTIRSFTANVNDHLPVPDTPKVDGYKFEGWYVDALNSGLKDITSDYKFDFAKNVMPYSKRSTLYIYAKLSKPLHPVTSLSLNHSSITDYTSNKAGVQLTATISPANADDPSVTWTSSNTNVVRVDYNGKVTFTGPGTATVTVRSDSNQKVSASCNFTVKQYVQNIRLTAAMASTVAGDTERLTAVINPNNATDKRLTWSSNNSSIATVDQNGNVTGHKNGFVTITATAKDGSGVKGSYLLRVMEEPAFPPTVPVTSVSLSTDRPTICTKDGYTQPFSYTVLPEDADDNSVVWTSSDPSVVSVDGSVTGQSVDAANYQNAESMFTLNGPGTAMITGRSLTNPRVSVTTNITVIQNVESIAITANRTSVDMGETAQLTAGVLPANASDRSVTWTVDDNQIGTVNSSGVFTGLTRGRVTVTAAANDGSGKSSTIRMTVGTGVPIPVESITLDQTNVTVHTNNIAGVQLTPTVLPADADDTSVYWESNNDQVATVGSNGLVHFLKAGTAVISCRSVSDPGVMGTCTFTVKQYADQLYVEGPADRLLPGETVQLTADFMPEDTTDKRVEWQSGNTAVATVDETGAVTAVAPGTAVIRALAMDGSDASGEYSVTVEKQLQLQVSMVNDTVFTQGSEYTDLAYVELSRASAQRMAAAGNDLTWTMTQTGSSDAEITVFTRDVDGSDSSFVLLSGSSFPTAGTNVYTVTCTAGQYQESVDIPVTVDGTAYAESLKLTNTELGFNTLTAGIYEPVLLPAVPYSADGKPVPAGLRMEYNGDVYYNRHASEAETADGLQVSFDESGIYTAVLYYTAANLTYPVEGTFNVADENGIVRIRVTGVDISDGFLSLAEGETYGLTAAVQPADAYEQTLTWESSDTSVATVTQNGEIHATAPGVAVVTAVANDGSGFVGICTVSVESYLQLDEKELEYTVYTGGEQRSDLGIINVTIDSARRLTADGLNVTWTLERLSGTGAEIGLYEFTSQYEDGLSVSGNTIKLLRANGAGTNIFRLTCSAENYTDSTLITINSVNTALPNSLTLDQTAYSGTIGEYIGINTDYNVLPAGIPLPEDAVMSIDGGNAFWNAVSGLYSFSEPEQLIFKRAGTFTANVIYTGSNYRYVCPITITVADEEGIVPVDVETISVDEEVLYLSTGDVRTLTAEVLPVNAPHSQVTWSSSNSAVASVSSSGKVTAIGPGYALIIASVPESDETGGCLVYVEEGINFRDENLERTVFADGTTRMVLDTVMLTDNTSSRLQEAPEWSLRRVSGISLTLRAYPYETVDINGNTLYGCRLMLYSVSKPGDTEYELTCTSGQDSKTLPIIVHAVNRNRNIPASIGMEQTVFNAGINELIAFTPQLTVYPEESLLPNGIKVSCEGGKQFLEALNPEDNYVSQSLSTFSFNKAGTYEADFIFWYSNVQYRTTVVFRIHDANGYVPVQASRLDLNHRNLYMTAGQSETLEAVFTPAGATNKQVTWLTSDPSVATVSETGVVEAVGNGSAIISCVPSDPECEIVTCSVMVENEMTVEPGVTSRTVYIQGHQENNIAAVMLSEGTIERLQTAGIIPEWTVDTGSVAHAELSYTIAEGNIGVLVNTEELISGGSDTYTVSCTAGTLNWSRQYTLEVVDLGANAPESVTIAKTAVTANLNQPVSIDFTPILSPGGAAMPADMSDTGFVGAGAYYEAMDWDQYSENGNIVTVAFTKPGNYLLMKRFLLSNLEYVTYCTISVGGTAGGRNLLAATETQFTVYSGGRSGNISNVALTDAVVYQLMANSIRWDAERISGDSLTVGLKEHGDNVDVFVANVMKKGTDVWRISCSFGDITEYVDITVTSDDPIFPLPESIALANDQFSGMIGNWIYIPLGVTCSPAGSRLPDQGDAFWTFSFDQAGEERSAHVIENGRLRVRFNMSGYYKGTLVYRSGNVSYSVPIYFIIQDEEQEVRKPVLNLYAVNVFDNVYPEGETEIVIGQVIAAEGMSVYNTGAAAAYMKNNPGIWTIRQTGSAASLALEKISENAYNIVLRSINGTGNMTFSVNCTLPDETVLTVSDTLHIAGSAEARPDATLLHTVYQTETGRPLRVDRQLYSRSDGSILQSSADWDPSPLLSAVGYEIRESDKDWSITFYEPGTYNATVWAYASNLKLEIPLTITVSRKGEGIVKKVLALPARLTRIEGYAFEGITADVVDLSRTNVNYIADWAFKNCVNITEVHLPDNITQIGDNAFYGCLNASFYCNDGTYGASWASEHGFTVVNP